METMKPKPQPLQGVRVLDLSHVYNGPYATFLMALAGAEVIKIEPFGGEHLRSRGDMGGADLPFAMLNSNKKSLALDLKSQAGKQLLRSLVEKSDILVENFSPGVMERLDLGADKLLEINPKLIYGSSSGYGKDGPYKDMPAMDLVMQAMAGILDSTGHPDEPPVKSGAAFCDFMAGIHLYGAIMTALYEREKTGLGRVVEVSMQESVYPTLASNLGMLHARGEKAPARTGNRHGGLGISPYNLYPANDGYVVLNCPGDHHFQALLKAMDREDLLSDERLTTRQSRVQNSSLVDDLIGAWTHKLGKYEIAYRMRTAEVPVPCAVVRNLKEVVHDENLHARGFLQPVDHPQLGRVILPHSPFNFQDSERLPLQPSEDLGQSSHHVLQDILGMSDEEIAELTQVQAIKIKPH